MTATITEPRAPRDADPSPAPRRRIVVRHSRGHVLMVVAGLAAAVLSFAALRSEPGDARIAVAAHEIRAGERVTTGDLRVERVAMSDDLLSSLVPAGRIGAQRGRVAAWTIAEGELVSRRALRPRAARHGLRAMSVPIDPSRAVGGRLAPGDRVDVLYAGERAVSIIVADAEVLAVDARGRGGIGETASPFTVTIAVDAEQSQLVAAAVTDGGLSLARTTGSEPSAGLAPESLDRVADVDAGAR